jgi:ABC-2 type transport system permease protein
VVTAFNPLTYVSEGIRGALVPGVPHIRPLLCIGALLLSLAVFSWVGIRGFMRQAID